jgi:hypothetical protein
VIDQIILENFATMVNNALDFIANNGSTVYVEVVPAL